MGASSSTRGQAAKPSTSSRSYSPSVPDTPTEEEKEGIRTMVEESNEIRLMVTGKTGVGKSSLLNGILGERICEEGEDLDPQTLVVEEHTAVKAGVAITVFDTPGLQDGSGNEQQYLQDMKEKCTDIHLLVYCISLLEIRGDLNAHNSAITKITNTFGAKMWENAVVVLTFANAFEDRLKTDKLEDAQIKTKFKEKVKEWENAFHSALKAAGVSNKLCKNIHALPAGYDNKTSLISQEHWLSKLWIESLLAMREDAQAAMIKISASRLQEKGDTKPEDFNKDISEQPVVFSKLTVKEVVKSATVEGTAVGAAVGAMIGTFAIGIPSFGIAASLGFAIGVALGGGAGSSGGVLVGLYRAIYYRQKRKKEMIQAMEQLGDALAK